MLILYRRIMYEENIQRMIENNSLEYNWKKLAEELFELGEVAMKMINKKPDSQPKLEKFVEEAGDVVLRIDLLSRVYKCQDLVEERMLLKAEKLAEYIHEGKYVGGA